MNQTIKDALRLAKQLRKRREAGGPMTEEEARKIVAETPEWDAAAPMIRYMTGAIARPDVGPERVLSSMAKTPEFAKEFAKGAYESAVSGASFPHDVVTGQIDPMSDEGIKRAWDLAGLAQTGSFAFTKPKGALSTGMAREEAPQMTKTQSQEAMKKLWEEGGGDTANYKNWNHQWNLTEKPKFDAVRAEAEAAVSPSIGHNQPLPKPVEDFSTPNYKRITNPAGFYSRAHEAAMNELPNQPRTWSEMWNKLSKLPNVKSAELRWAGLHPETWPADQKVTREEIAKLIEKNFPQVSHVIKQTDVPPWLEGESPATSQRLALSNELPETGDWPHYVNTPEFRDFEQTYHSVLNMDDFAQEEFGLTADQLNAEQRRQLRDILRPDVITEFEDLDEFRPIVEGAGHQGHFEQTPEYQAHEQVFIDNFGDDYAEDLFGRRVQDLDEAEYQTWLEDVQNQAREAWLSEHPAGHGPTTAPQTRPRSITALEEYEQHHVEMEREAFARNAYGQPFDRLNPVDQETVENVLREEANYGWENGGEGDARWIHTHEHALANRDARSQELFGRPYEQLTGEGQQEIIDRTLREEADELWTGQRREIQPVTNLTREQAFQNYEDALRRLNDENGVDLTPEELRSAAEDDLGGLAQHFAERGPNGLEGFLQNNVANELHGPMRAFAEMLQQEGRPRAQISNMPPKWEQHTVKGGQYYNERILRLPYNERKMGLHPEVKAQYEPLIQRAEDALRAADDRANKLAGVAEARKQQYREQLQEEYEARKIDEARHAGKDIIAYEELVDLRDLAIDAQIQADQARLAFQQSPGASGGTHEFEVFEQARDLARSLGRRADDEYAKIRRAIYPGGFRPSTEKMHEVLGRDVNEFYALDNSPEYEAATAEYEQARISLENLRREMSKASEERHATDVGDHPPYTHELYQHAMHLGNIDNPLVHTRNTTRFNKAGEKILHNEETQSDIGQTGEKEGFKGPPLTKAEKKEYDELYGLDFDKMTPGQKARFLGLEKKYQASLDGTPRMPHIETSQEWIELAAKDLITEALENNYDKIFITGGQEQAARWQTQLRKAVDNIRWETMAPVDEDHLFESILELGPTREDQETAARRLYSRRYSELTEDQQLEADMEGTNIRFGRTLKEAQEQEGVKIVSAKIAGSGRETPFTIKKDDKGVWRVVVSPVPEAKNKPIESVVGRDLAKKITGEDEGNIDMKGFRLGAEGYTETYERKLPGAIKRLLKAFDPDVKVEAGHLDSNAFADQYDGPSLDYQKLMNWKDRINVDLRAGTRPEIVPEHLVPEDIETLLGHVMQGLQRGMSFEESLATYGTKELEEFLQHQVEPNRKIAGTWISITPKMRSEFQRIMKKHGAVFQAYWKGGRVRRAEGGPMTLEEANKIVAETPEWDAAAPMIRYATGAIAKPEIGPERMLSAAAKVPEFAKEAARGAYDAIVSGATLPGDVATGKVDPMSDEGVKRALDLAGLAQTGSFAFTRPPGSLATGAARIGHNNPPIETPPYQRLTNPVGMFSRAHEAAMTELPDQPRTWQEMWSILSKRPGVQGEELRWSGLHPETWDPKQKVSREEIAERIKRGFPQVSVDLYGHNHDLKKLEQAYVEANDALEEPLARFKEAYPSPHDRNRLIENYLAEPAETLAELPPEHHSILTDYLAAKQARGLAKNEFENAQWGAKSAKYARYTVPGGENYNERVLRLPYEDTFMRDTHPDIEAKYAPEMDRLLDAHHVARNNAQQIQEHHEQAVVEPFLQGLREKAFDKTLAESEAVGKKLYTNEELEPLSQKVQAAEQKYHETRRRSYELNDAYDAGEATAEEVQASVTARSAASRDLDIARNTYYNAQHNSLAALKEEIENYTPIQLARAADKSAEYRKLINAPHVRLAHDEAESIRQQLESLRKKRQAESDALHDAQTPIFAQTRYTHSHFSDVDNPAVHTRNKDRIGPNGEKIYHIDEFQGDRAQEGVEKGLFDPEERKRLKARQQEIDAATADIHEQLKDKYGPNFGDHPQGAQEYLDLTRDLEDEHASISNQLNQMGKIPDAPYAGDTRQWLKLAAKDSLIRALEGDYDEIFITGGQEQAKRWANALRQAVDKVRWETPVFQEQEKAVADWMAKRDDLRNQLAPVVWDSRFGAPENGVTVLYEGLTPSLQNTVDQMIRASGKLGDVPQHVPEGAKVIYAKPLNSDRESRFVVEPKTDKKGKTRWTITDSSVPEAIGEPLSALGGGDLAKRILEEESGEQAMNGYRMGSSGYSHTYETLAPSVYKDLIKGLDPEAAKAIGAHNLGESVKIKDVSDMTVAELKEARRAYDEGPPLGVRLGEAFENLGQDIIDGVPVGDAITDTSDDLKNYLRSFLKNRARPPLPNLTLSRLIDLEVQQGVPAEVGQEIYQVRNLMDRGNLSFADAVEAADAQKLREYLAPKGVAGTRIPITKKMREEYKRLKQKFGAVFPAYRKGGKVEKTRYHRPRNGDALRLARQIAG